MVVCKKVLEFKTQNFQAWEVLKKALVLEKN